MIRRALLAIAAAMTCGCTDTMIGPFIEPTHHVRTAEELDNLGIGLGPGSETPAWAICGRRYDREFAPWGEHYRERHWHQSRAFARRDFDVNAIIDVDTGRYDFGHVALVWRSNGERVKVFTDQFWPADALIPDEGCHTLGELRSRQARSATE